MQSNTARALVAIAAVVIVVVAFVLISGGDDSSDSETAGDTASTQTITVENGEPVGGVAELTYDKGDEMNIVVKSDEAAEVHMHGYDVMKEVEAGGSAEFNVPADLDGEFEMELEETATPIAAITVNP